MADIYNNRGAIGSAAGINDTDNSSKKQDANIKVAVRCRPPLDFEIRANHTFDKLLVESSQKGVR